MKKILLLVILFASFSAHAEVNITRGIQYGANEKQIIDIYQPDICANKHCPVAIWVHGGGWKHGDMRRSSEMQTAWAEQGIITVGVNYRLSPDYVHPTHVMDIAAAINWVNKHISQYNGDPNRVSLFGHSAGAHLVALVATNPKYLRTYGLTPTKAIANVFPIDTASFDLTNASRFVNRLVKDAFGTNPERLKEASPIFNVIPGGDYPPFIIAAAKNRDDAVETSEIFRNKLIDAGVEAQLIIINYPRTGALRAHGNIGRELGDMNSEMTKTLIKRVLSN